MDKMEESLLVIKKSVRKKPIKTKEEKDNDWNTVPVTDLSREEAIERFMRLKAEEKRYKPYELYYFVDKEK